MVIIDAMLIFTEVKINVLEYVIINSIKNEI